MTQIKNGKAGERQIPTLTMRVPRLKYLRARTTLVFPLLPRQEWQLSSSGAGRLGIAHQTSYLEI
jgi:hypothetical protein